MFRPLTLLGTFVIAIALLSYLLIPDWRSSPVGIGALIVCLALGAYAIVRDLRDFWKELSKPKDKEPRSNDRQD